jgi:hypothetical protein
MKEVNKNFFNFFILHFFNLVPRYIKSHVKDIETSYSKVKHLAKSAEKIRQNDINKLRIDYHEI